MKKIYLSIYLSIYLLIFISTFSGKVFADNYYNPDPFCLENGSGLLEKLEVPAYMARGISARIKADLTLPIGAFKNVKYYTSEDDYVGDDIANIESNSYKHIVFNDSFSDGEATIWAWVDGMCAYKKLVVHGAPTFTTVSINESSSISLTFSAKLTIDWALYSEALVTNRSKVITWYFKNDCTAYKFGKCAYPEENFQPAGTTLSGDLKTFTFDNTAPRTIKATMTDGITFKQKIFLIGDQAANPHL